MGGGVVRGEGVELHRWKGLEVGGVDCLTGVEANTVGASRRCVSLYAVD